MSDLTVLHTFAYYIFSGASCAPKPLVYFTVYFILFQLSVQASDNRLPQAQSTQATVIVTVLRDLALPRFTNLPAAIDLDENTDINRYVKVYYLL